MTSLQNCNSLISTSMHAVVQSAKPLYVSPPRLCHTTDHTRTRNNDGGDTSLRRVFRLFDTNNDGVLSREEVQEALAKLGLGLASGGEKITMMIGEDGCLQFTDFESLYYESGELDEDEKYGAGEKSSFMCEDMWKAFCVYDKNGDGFINAEELQTVLCDLGLVPHDHKTNLSFCQELIRRHDLNSDGLIDFAEFQTMLSISD